MAVRYTVRATCEVQLIDRKRAKDFILVLGLNHRSVGYCKQC